MKSIFLYLFLLFAVTGRAPAQPPVLIDRPDFQQDARAAIDSLWNRKPEAARLLMEPWSGRYPDHPLWTLWEGMELWWEVLNDLHDGRRDEEFFRKMEQADHQAVQVLRRKSDHADALVVRAVANGYIARHLSNRNRWVRSIQTARVAMQAHSALAEIRPDLEEVYFAEGLKMYYSAYLPDAYPVIRAVSWLLPSGDREKGLDLLRSSSRGAVFARPEATYFLGNILLNYEKKYEEALHHFQKLTELYPDNGYYRRLLVRTLFRQQLDREAEAEIDRTLDYWRQHSFSDLDLVREELLYWKAHLHLRRGEYRSAHELFRQGFQAGEVLPDRENRQFHILSGYYSGITAEWSGDLEEARGWYRKVIDLKGEPDTRKQARKRLEEL